MNTSARHDFLLEIGTEELPSRSLKSLIAALASGIKEGLAKAGLEHEQLDTFVTPRRLAVLVKQLAAAQATRLVERKGPLLSAAYDAQGQPTKACLGFAQSCGVEVKDLQVQETEKGQWLYFQQEQAGAETITLLPEIVRHAINKLPIPKPMRWSDSDTEFVRPVHWVVMLFDSTRIDAEILGQTTTEETYGHRFHHPGPLLINHPQNYAEILENPGYVLADFTHRKNKIKEQISHLASQYGTAIIDEDLLDEVTGLVEWPTALLGHFDPTFLKVPPEALISSMKNHQKCFPVIDTKEKLLPYFITVSNILSKDPAEVIKGNERVIRARLSDAHFFYQTDSKQALESHLEKLKTVIFQKQLGSVYEKAERLAQLSVFIAQKLGADTKQAARAGLLAKTDLMTSMVGEFPELQGIMGYYYAKQDKEADTVAIAIREQYLPRFSGDDLPSTPIGCALAIADRLDTLVGIFGINQMPTGEKDPFGLRRAALGILRIIIERQLPLDLIELLEQAQGAYTHTGALENPDAKNQILTFMLERLRYWYLEQAVSTEVFAAVAARQPSEPLDFQRRVQAVQHFQQLPQAKSLAAANKRVSNILKKISVDPAQLVNPTLLEESSEKQLAELLIEKTKVVANLKAEKKYTEILVSLAELQEPVDLFFDRVLVMTDDEKLRNNRLILLSQLQRLFLNVADIALLN
jgi:glycyl-tRNA synthetase beta chain